MVKVLVAAALAVSALNAVPMIGAVRPGGDVAAQMRYRQTVEVPEVPTSATRPPWDSTSRRSPTVGERLDALEDPATSADAVPAGGLREWLASESR